jgi:hypothetical protein
MAFGILGLVGLFYPAKFLAFFLRGRTKMDVNDPSFWWIPRFIGVVFLIVALINAGITAK